MDLDEQSGCIVHLTRPSDEDSNFQEPHVQGSTGSKRPLTSLRLAGGQNAVLNLRKWIPQPTSRSKEESIKSLAVDAIARKEISQIVRKSDLMGALALRQIDHKFILGSIHDNDGAISLMLVDQHAADERIKVEEYYQQLSSGETTLLARPIEFEVDIEEGNRFEEARAYFRSWSVAYDVGQLDYQPTQGQVRIRITRLPTIIAERCRLEPKILIRILRTQLWSNFDYEIAATDGSSWLSRIENCPHGLLDLVNSRACRSAIMFNDVLTTDHCQMLLRRLSSCVFPFQCAHGRPSISILTNIENYSSFGFLDGQGGSFGKAFQRWRH
jgi:DNA mismatch repair protein MLH3